MTHRESQLGLKALNCLFVMMCCVNRSVAWSVTSVRISNGRFSLIFAFCEQSKETESNTSTQTRMHTHTHKVTYKCTLTFETDIHIVGNTLHAVYLFLRIDNKTKIDQALERDLRMRIRNLCTWTFDVPGDRWK